MFFRSIKFRSNEELSPPISQRSDNRRKLLIVLVPISSIVHFVNAAWAAQIQLQLIEYLHGENVSRTDVCTSEVSRYKTAVHAANNSGRLVTTSRHIHAPYIEGKFPLTAQLIVDKVFSHELQPPHI